MSLNWAKPNHNHASEYQVAGWPYVTASACDATPKRIEFPQTTQWFQLKVNKGSGGGGADIKLGFTSKGVSDGFHYLVENSDKAPSITPVFHVKCKEIWVAATAAGPVSFSLMAGLTNVTGSDFPVITGSNGFGGVG